jgi:hypothetical protein
MCRSIVTCVCMSSVDVYMVWENNCWSLTSVREPLELEPMSYKWLSGPLQSVCDECLQIRHILVRVNTSSTVPGGWSGLSQETKQVVSIIISEFGLNILKRVSPAIWRTCSVYLFMPAMCQNPVLYTRREIKPVIRIWSLTVRSRWRIYVLQHTVCSNYVERRSDCLCTRAHGVVVMTTASTSWGATAKPHIWEDPHWGGMKIWGTSFFPLQAMQRKQQCLAKERQSTQAIQSKVVRADVDVVGL